MSTILPVGVSSPTLPTFQVPSVVRLDKTANDHSQDTAQMQQLVQAPPKVAGASEANNVSSQFKESQQNANQQRRESQTAAAAVSNNSSNSNNNQVNVHQLMDSITAQRAAAKLMERASELERLAQALRAESQHNSTNNETTKSADSAIQEAHSAHAQSLNIS